MTEWIFIIAALANIASLVLQIASFIGERRRRRRWKKVGGRRPFN